MIEIPIWIFIVLLAVFSLFMFFVIFGIIQAIHDKIIDFIKWKTDYNKYKKFYDDHEDWRYHNE